MQFALSGLAAVLVVGVVGAFLLRRAAESESIRDARQVTELLARTVIDPNLSEGVVRGDPDAIERFDRTVRARVLADPVVRVKLWTREGRVVYSDEKRLIGAVYPLDEDDLESLDTGKVIAGLSDLSSPENRFERAHDKLLEVYLPAWVPGQDEPLLFEAYLRFGSVAADARRMSLDVAPALGAALVLLWLIQLPLAWSLARRLREGQRQREALLERALVTSDADRRLIAADLHDGVVQDLAGVALSLGAAVDRAEEPEVKSTLHGAAEETRRSMRRLRSLLVEIYPPNLESAGLEAALSDLVAPLSGKGIEATLEVEPGFDAPPAVEQLMFRAAQEALRNVAVHSYATNVELRVSRSTNRAVLLVADDGRGFSPALAEQRREGHLGLSLLADLVADAGGELRIESEPGRGTRVTLEVPTA